MSATQEAVQMVLAGASVRDASRAKNLSEAAVRMAVKKLRAAAAGVCPHCGQPLPSHDPARSLTHDT